MSVIILIKIWTSQFTTLAENTETRVCKTKRKIHCPTPGWPSVSNETIVDRRWWWWWQTAITHIGQREKRRRPRYRDCFIDIPSAARSLLHLFLFPSPIKSSQWVLVARKTVSRVSVLLHCHVYLRRVSGIDVARSSDSIRDKSVTWLWNQIKFTGVMYMCEVLWYCSVSINTVEVRRGKPTYLPLPTSVWFYLHYRIVNLSHNNCIESHTLGFWKRGMVNCLNVRMCNGD